jgi:antitoxin component YwqK of YwqJK toxin-antitoxin module
LSETPYKNNQIHGIGKWYYENGGIEFEIPYKNGFQHGIKINLES